MWLQNEPSSKEDINRQQEKKERTRKPHTVVVNILLHDHHPHHLQEDQSLDTLELLNLTSQINDDAYHEDNLLRMLTHVLCDGVGKYIFKSSSSLTTD